MKYKRHVWLMVFLPCFILFADDVLEDAGFVEDPDFAEVVIEPIEIAEPTLLEETDLNEPALLEEEPAFLDEAEYQIVVEEPVIDEVEPLLEEEAIHIEDASIEEVEPLLDKELPVQTLPEDVDVQPVLEDERSLVEEKSKPVKPQKFFMMSQYKAGTHLLAVTLTEMTGRKHFGKKDLKDIEKSIRGVEKAFASNKFVRAHGLKDSTWNMLMKAGYKFVYIIRDPRDRLISRIFYRQKLYPEEKAYHNPTKSQVIDIARMYVTKGHFPWGGSEESLPNYAFDKRYQDVICIVRFEDLVGSQGGGSDKKQLETLQRINDFLGLQHSQKELQRIGYKVFGHPNSRTFRKGVIGGWRDYFDDKMIKAHKKRFGKYMEQMGYSYD